MVTKIEAAEKQLDTAIKLFFENVDHLSCFTLAAASREITDDLCEKRMNEIYRSELERLGDPQKVRLSFRDEMEILKAVNDLAEGLQEGFAIPIFLEDVFSRVAAGGHMVQRAVKFYSERTSHYLAQVRRRVANSKIRFC